MQRAIDAVWLSPAVPTDVVSGKKSRIYKAASATSISDRLICPYEPLFVRIIYTSKEKTSVPIQQAVHPDGQGRGGAQAINKIPIKP